MKQTFPYLIVSAFRINKKLSLDPDDEIHTVYLNKTNKKPRNSKGCLLECWEKLPTYIFLYDMLC